MYKRQGVKVYSYAEGVAALRNGQTIDYSGVTGDMDYTSTGVVSGLYGVFEWTSLDSLNRIESLDDRTVLALDG